MRAPATRPAGRLVLVAGLAERARGILDASLERGDLTQPRLHRVVVAAMGIGWSVGIRHVDRDTNSGSARIYGPTGELEAARHRFEAALAR